MGRKRLAEEVKEANGYYKKNPQRRKEAGAKGDGTAPIKPDYLNEIASKKWDETIAVLDELGVLSSTDADLLTIYCMTWANFRAAQAGVAKHGLTVEGRDGPKRNPEDISSQQMVTALAKMVGELGLSPSGRARLKGATPKKDDKPKSALDQLRLIGAKDVG